MCSITGTTVVNIAPTQEVPVVRLGKDGVREGIMMRVDGRGRTQEPIEKRRALVPEIAVV